MRFRAIFRLFPRLELPAQSIPLTFMDVIGLFISMHHQRLAVMFDVAKGGEDHGAIVHSPLSVCQKLPNEQGV